MKNLNGDQFVQRARTRIVSKRWYTFMAGLLTFLVSTSAFSVSMPVPNGDFMAPGNVGQVGGGALGGSGSSPIGTGPWSGSYQGALALLAPPTLTITAGNASISGLLGVNALGIVNNGAHFSVDSGLPYGPDRRYVVAADVDVGGLLDMGALTSGNAGIAITRAGTRLASSTTSSNISLQLIAGNRYRLQLTYDTASTVSGNVGINLFAEPSGLLTAALFPTVNFSNVTLENRLLNQVPTSSVGVNSGPFNPVVDTVVSPALAVKVLDAQGDPISGIPVTWSAPSTGASATFSGATTFTDPTGVATVTATANTIAGSYQITATVSGVTPSTAFDMTNVAGAPSAMSVLIGPVQQARVNEPFALPLKVKVVDAFGNANQGVTATFTVPSTGASAILSGTTIATGADGTAQVTATANGLVGTYAITAQVSGTSANASFSFTNLLPASIVSNPAGQPSQHGEINQAFSCALVVRVADQIGNPMPGLAVDFIAPGSGPSSMLQSGASTGLSLRVMTDADGLAWVNSTANEIMGNYDVVAQLAFSTTSPIIFSMRNMAVGDPQFFAGFDGPCLAPGALEDTSRQ